MDKKKQDKKTKSKAKKTKFCRHCGAEMKAGARACPSCKKKQEGPFKIISIILNVLLLIVIAILLLSFNAENKNAKSPSSKEDGITGDDKPQESEQPQENTTYSIGQPWVVDGQWSLTINGITATDQRNEFEERNPAQVFIIDYTYENIGYIDESGMMNGLFIDLSSGQIIDSTGLMGYSYPGDITNYPQETPVGVTCNAQACIAVDNASTEIKIIVNMYDRNSNSHSATFIMPIG